jgi:hypothetical protein
MEIKIIDNEINESVQDKLEEIDVETYLKDALAEAVYNIFSEAELTGKIRYSVVIQNKELIFGTINMEHMEDA